MQRRFIYILLTLLTLSIVNLYSSNERYIKREITTIDGLSQNDVKSMLQDSYGFIWIATNDGLCRYDGYEFRSFSTGDLGLESNLILSITEDRESNIWIGTADKGIFVYDRTKCRFRHYTEISDSRLPYIHSAKELCVAPNGDILAVDNRALQIIRLKYNSQSELITRFNCYTLTDEYININKLITTPSKIYAGTNKGVYQYDYREDRFHLIESKQHTPAVIDMEARGEVLFISSFKSFVSLNTRTGRVIKHEFKSNPINFHFTGSTMWFTSNNGVYTTHYAPRRDKFYNTELVESFSDITTHTIIADHNGGVWIGLNKEGILRYEPNNKPFSIAAKLGNNHISQIYNVEDREILVGTEGSGLFILDSLKQNLGIRNYLEQSDISAIEYSKYDDRIYVASNSNIFRVDPNNLTKYELAFRNAAIRKMLSDGEYLWMASYIRGLIRYDLRDGSSIDLGLEDNLPSTLLRNIMIDSKGNLWICSERGVSLITANERLNDRPLIKSVLSESSQYSIPIIESRNGDIWYGTLGNGLYRLRYKADSEMLVEVTNITRHDGLSNNTIKSIVEDHAGNLWVSTNRGINKLTINYSTPAQSSVIERHNRVGVVDKGVTITKYNMYSGLQDYEFNELSSAQLPDGTILLGGVAGLNYFNPKDIKQDTIKAKGVITDLKVGDRSIYDGGLNSVIPSGLQGKEGYSLTYDQNNISIKFAALHYLNPEMNSYKYHLEGYDRGWINSPEGVRMASYSNLPPGRYIFGLKVANSDGVWSDSMLTIPIVIAPPFWASWYAYILYGIVLLMIGLFIITYSHDVIERRNAIALANMERKKINELLEIRTRFFTNISHEFRTPLTLILSPLQELMSDSQITSNKRWREMLQIMVHNGNSLMRLTNEFLSYTKQESGGLKVNLSNGELVEMSNRLFEQFRFWCDQRELKLHFESSSNHINIEYDPYLIEQVIYNLVSNAIKHTPTGGDVTMSINEDDNQVVISVSDTGHGIPEDKKQYIFNRFFSSATESSKEVGGTGVGLYLSKSIVLLHGGEIWFETAEGKGTSFHFSLPKRAVRSLLSREESSEVIINSDISTLERESIVENQEDELIETQRATLLIIDDNVDLLHLLRTLFESQYNVLTAENGVEGLECAIKELPEIIISDVMMPQMDGLEFCERTKNNPTTSHIPIILLSAKATNEDVLAGLRISADAYCPKPFNNEVLREMVATTLNNRRRLAHKYSTLTLKDDENQSAEIDEQSTEIELFGHEVTTSTDREFIKRLVSYIESNIHNPDLVVADLCSEMGVTSLVLNKKLKSLIDMTSNSLIRTIKLRRAAMLLRTTRYSIADVTYDVGFSDLRYFRECFKREYGVLPQEYKKMISENSIEE